MIDNLKAYLIKRIFGNNALRYNKQVSLDSYCTKFLNSLDIDKIVKENVNDFNSALDALTFELLNEFPQSGKFWGTSRHVLNTFFRELYLNHQFYEAYSLVKIENYLEAPINKQTISYLMNSEEGALLSKIPPIIKITPEINNQIQKVVKMIALKNSIKPVLIEFMITV